LNYGPILPSWQKIISLFFCFFMSRMQLAPFAIFFQLYFFLGSFFILPTEIIDALAFAAL